MAQLFQTNKPEKQIQVIITAREVHLLKVIRTIDFGDIIVKKANGIIIRVEPKTSILIEEQEGLAL